jgi:small neutral amino acid transporter SnatA (MarC family)
VDTRSIDFALVVDLFLLLLIGIGPKIALVPFLELTGGMDEATKARVVRKTMILGNGEDKRSVELGTSDPLRLAVYPLAVPYLLNPVGIVVLVTVSAESESAGRIGLVVGLVALVLALDVAVFRWANRVGEHLDQSRLVVAEKVFGFLLAAIAVQLALTGLDGVGVIHFDEH